MLLYDFVMKHDDNKDHFNVTLKINDNYYNLAEDYEAFNKYKASTIETWYFDYYSLTYMIELDL